MTAGHITQHQLALQAAPEAEPDMGKSGNAEKKKGSFAAAFFPEFLARPERFERPTLWFVAKYSIQLSYGRAAKIF